MAATRRPFTLVVCAGCDVTDDVSVLEPLRRSVRRCPHGVLVAASRPAGPQTWVVMQPCWPDRTPVGPPRWLGPIVDVDDARDLADWVERGEWDVEVLPPRLRAAALRG